MLVRLNRQNTDNSLLLSMLICNVVWLFFGLRFSVGRGYAQSRQTERVSLAGDPIFLNCFPKVGRRVVISGRKAGAVRWGSVRSM